MNPIKEHKALIEGMVARTPSPGAYLVRTESLFSKAKTHKHLNDLVAKLTTDERELLAQMLEHEKSDGIFQALVHISEACTLGGLKLVKDGMEIPPEPFGYTLFEEYITLLHETGDWSSMEK